MGIFYSKHCDPRRKKLDQALNNLNLSFQTWDFTDSEQEVWFKQAQALKELKEDFMAEGNQAGYNICKVDCESWLPVLEEGKGHRYLYHVKLPISFFLDLTVSLVLYIPLKNLSLLNILLHHHIYIHLITLFYMQMYQLLHETVHMVLQ